MKKLLFLFACCLFMCGCDKNNGYQVSELIPNTDVGLLHLKGTIKNVSNDKCEEIAILVELTSGSIKEERRLIMDSPKKGEIVKFNELISSDLENFETTVKAVECWDF